MWNKSSKKTEKRKGHFDFDRHVPRPTYHQERRHLHTALKPKVECLSSLVLLLIMNLRQTQSSFRVLLVHKSRISGGFPRRHAFTSKPIMQFFSCTYRVMSIWWHVFDWINARKLEMSTNVALSFFSYFTFFHDNVRYHVKDSRGYRWWQRENAWISMEKGDRVVNGDCIVNGDFLSSICRDSKRQKRKMEEFSSVH